MSRFRSYLYSAVRIIESYKGETPLAVFLKNYFSENKKYGARDRRQIAALCYYYFRIGKAAESLSVSDKIILGTFLCENEPSEFLETVKPEWNDQIENVLKKKLALVKTAFSIDTIFLFKKELSAGINMDAFSTSFLIQPDLFIRIRPKVRLGVLSKLEKSKLPYRLLDDDCVALPNSTKIEDYFTLDKEVVIQDLNSQRVLNFFKPQHATHKTPAIPAWDCCAASGGKSILLYDIFNQRIDLTISDIRPSIILNLHHRFAKAGIKSYKYFIGDLASPKFTETLPVDQQDNLKPAIVICDVPCTGSGTWSRTPEQLVFFTKEKISAYSLKQKQIVTNVIPYLQKDSALVYITCSVFKEENEEVVAFIKDKFQLELVQQELLQGYAHKADTMFVAIFRKR
ncbi:RsmB/NOP family class I SAM-dependent RNA methyltransferase [Ferruginibacter albus]|uniref:Fmu (Sun) domain-containing protein n=1 Tax=Ferruginibacter albus TaxID=2875540 RepID=UPI001CC75625|nr:Fmu (Sun) domain-containing protein [Ferruginibacter albus]UAY51722.1 Fmu (Sun) domain-containing protein [Ferruginibacter albus]